MLNFECKVENKGPIRRELTISVKPESIAAAIDKQLGRLQKTAKVKGFRAGKVPLTLIRQHYLQDVKSDVFSNVVRESYIKALEDNKILAVGSPEIETKSGASLNDGETLTYIATIEIFPDFKVSDLSKIKAAKKSAVVSAADIEKSVQNLLENHAEMLPDDSNNGPVKNGSFVQINFAGTVDGEALDSLKGDGRLVEVGSKNYMEDFENGMIGMKKGETKEFDVKFPKDFSEPKLAGKTVKFSVTVLEFKKKQLPKFDDEFAKNFKMESAAELRKKVEETLKEDRQKEADDSLKEAIYRALLDSNKFEVPSSMVQSQLEYLLNENATFLKRQGFTEKMARDYIDQNREQLNVRAEEQVRVSLILDKIATDQKIAIEAKDLDHEYSTIAARVNLPMEQVRTMYSSDENAVRQLRYRLKEQRAYEFVISQAKVTAEKA